MTDVGGGEGRIGRPRRIRGCRALDLDWGGRGGVRQRAGQPRRRDCAPSRWRAVGWHRPRRPAGGGWRRPGGAGRWLGGFSLAPFDAARRGASEGRAGQPRRAGGGRRRARTGRPLRGSVEMCAKVEMREGARSYDQLPWISRNFRELFRMSEDFWRTLALYGKIIFSAGFFARLVTVL